jgi:hypothetical protein
LQIGLPIWNCVVSSTPAGNTTLGQATLAVLNDLGVVAEHLLVYLNANGQLTYEENIVNDFVSLTNPLYPTGPRLNFSIDFSAVTKDSDLYKVRLILIIDKRENPNLKKDRIILTTFTIGQHLW